MSRAYIVSIGGEEGGDRVPVDQPVILGRTKDCTIVLDDAAASRHHMEIIPRQESFYWKDLNSTNGVFINDQSMKEGELRDGDRIKIGSTIFLFEIARAEAAEDPKKDPPSGKLRQEADTTIFRETIMGPEGEPISIEDRSELHDMLEALHIVTQEIATDYDPCALVDRVLETTIRAVQGQRGAIFFANTGSTDLLPCSYCGNVHVLEDGFIKHQKTSELQVSQTVARRVLRHGESVLIQDTQDSGASSTESIMSLQIRSILCVPLRGKYGVFGILYIDTDRPELQYNRNHMLLTTAVGGSAGLALENARLHQEMLERIRTDQEIEYAGSIQSGFLIHEWSADDSRFQVFGDMRPAKTVGGDFYDFVQVSKDEVGILIGDVSGKGVPAALTMAQVLADFRVRVTRETEPAAVVRALNNNLVKQSQRGMFCTLFYVTLNLKTGVIKSANAGHHEAILANADGCSEFGQGKNPPIGIMDNVEWQQNEGSLAAGDMIVLYTDGISEARSNATEHGLQNSTEVEMYGSERLCELLSKSPGRAPQALAASVFDDVWDYCDPHSPHDDCTIIAIRYTP